MTTTWHGVTLDDRTAAMMDEVTVLLGYAPTPTQGSYSVSVGASAGTHSGGGAIDVVGADLDAIVIAMRMVGFAAWHRTPAQGFIEHVHGIAVGCPDLSPQAASQVSAYFAGLNGLASNGPDDGPRDWVGVTWETYNGGTPLDPGTVRPVGHPFWGESRPPEDWRVLSGSADYIDSDGTATVGTAFAGGAARMWGEGDGLDGDDYIRVPVAAKLLWIFASAPTYLKVGDNVTVSWIVRARGSGTISITNDRDTSWDYTDPAGGVIGSATVSGGAWTEHEFTTTEFTNAELLEPAGGYRLAVDVVGAVDIDVVQLRIWPPDGVVGGYGNDVTEATRDVSVNGSQERVGVTGPTYTDWDTAFLDGAAAVSAAPVRNLSDAFIPTLTVRAEADWISNLAGTIHLYEWQHATGYLSFDAGLETMIPDPPGTDGVDYIRRPDRTYADVRAYFIWSGSSLPTVVSWNNAVAYYTELAQSDDAGYDYMANLPTVSFDVVDYIEPVPGFNTDQTSPVAWPYAASGYSITPSLAGSTGSMTFAPPLEGTFSLIFDHTWFTSKPDEPDLTGLAGNGTGLAAQVAFEIGATGATLSATVQLPNYLIWQPGWWQGPDDPDGNPVVTWLRQRQRNDGLGNSITRARGASSQQMSLRQRGYR